MKEQVQYLMGHSAPVMTRQQEREVFRIMNVAKMQVVRLEKLKKRTRTQAGQLGCARRDQRLAREKIILSNMGLIINMARKSRARNIDFDSLVSEGTMVITRAVDKFKVTRGTKFSTYVCRSLINAFVRMGILQGRKEDRCIEDHDLAMKNVETATYDSHTALEISELHEILEHNLAQLSEDETTVIRKRFGLGCEPHTLEQLGGILGISKERVRQVQNITLGKLRAVMKDSESG